MTGYRYLDEVKGIGIENVLPEFISKEAAMGMYNPPHPGEITREFCVDALELSITAAANALGVSRETFSALLNGRSGINPEMALRLSKVFGRTPEGWLRLQLQYDLWKTEQNIDLSALKRIKVA